MVNYVFKGEVYYLSIKGSAMSSVENVWCRFGYRNPDKIGYDMYLVEKYKPSSLEEFFEKYIKDFTTIDDPLHGRNIGMIETIAIAFKEDCEKYNKTLSLSIEDYMDIIVLHAIVETWEGYKSEEIIRKLLVREGNEIINCDTKYWEIYPEMEKQGRCFDSWAAIDIVSCYNGIINRLIQVKPISTFTSTHPKTIGDRLKFDKHNMDGIDFIKKHMPYKLSKGIYVKYMIYHKNDDGTLSWYYIERNGKKRYDFKLKELLNTRFANKLFRDKTFDKI